MSADVSAITRHWHSSLALVAGVATVAMSAPPAQVARYAGAMADCAFCNIETGAAPASMVWSDDRLMAFLDTRPVFKGHTLLVPREHFVTLPDLPEALLAPFLAMGQHLATAMVEGLGAQGSFMGINNVVSQTVPHLHLHVVPRTRGDRLRGFFWPRQKYADDGERESYAKSLRSYLEANA